MKNMILVSKSDMKTRSTREPGFSCPVLTMLNTIAYHKLYNKMPNDLSVIISIFIYIYCKQTRLTNDTSILLLLSYRLNN